MHGAAASAARCRAKPHTLQGAAPPVRRAACGAGVMGGPRADGRGRAAEHGRAAGAPRGPGGRAQDRRGHLRRGLPRGVRRPCSVFANPTQGLKPCCVRLRGPRIAMPRQPGRRAVGGGWACARARLPAGLQRPRPAGAPAVWRRRWQERAAARRARTRSRSGGRAGRRVVLKIMPMEGAARVNGEPQKGAGEVAAEVAIALALSDLRHAGARPARRPGASPPRRPAHSRTVRHALRHITSTSTAQGISDRETAPLLLRV